MTKDKKSLGTYIADGWMNLLTGLGIKGRDKNVCTTFGPAPVFDEGMLNDIYRADGLGRRVIDAPADHMTRNWIRVSGDEDGLLESELKRLKTKTRFNKSEKWSRLYGAGVILMRIDDGRGLDEPLNMDGIRSIEKLKVYDRYRVQPYKWYDDPEDPNIGEVELYQITPRRGNFFYVHESRVLVFNGVNTPELAKEQNQHWEDSVIESCFYALRRLGNVYGSVEAIMSSFETGVLNVEDLAEKIASGQEDQIMKRLELMNLSKAVVNMMLLDKEETWEKKSSTVTGIPDVLDRFSQNLSASSGIPITVLMGTSPAGMNATGESDIRNWYDKIKSDQEDKHYDHLKRLSLIIQLAKDGPFKGKELKSWDILFNSLWQMTPKEEAEVRKITAERDKLDIENDIVSEDEIRQSRYGGEEYSMETKLDPRYDTNRNKNKSEED